MAKARGFAAMDEKKQRQIASLGGRAAHEKGTAHEFTPEEARRAGREGGKIVSRDRKHMAELGRKGGLASHQKGATQVTSQSNGNGRRGAASANASKARTNGRKGRRTTQKSRSG